MNSYYFLHSVVWKLLGVLVEISLYNLLSVHKVMSMMPYNVIRVLLQTVEYKQGQLFVFELKAIFKLT